MIGMSVIDEVKSNTQQQPSVKSEPELAPGCDSKNDSSNLTRSDEENSPNELKVNVIMQLKPK